MLLLASVCKMCARVQSSMCESTVLLLASVCKMFAYVHCKCAVCVSVYTISV